MNFDLSDYLDDLRRHHPEELVEINAPVERDYTITACALELEREGRYPALLFNNVAGSPMPVLSNLFASRRRIALLLNLDERDLVEGWIRLSQRRVPPVPSREAPVQEQIFTGDQIDLRRYPIPIHFEVDAGQYITGGVVLSRDPDTGVGNLSYARMQLIGPAAFGVSLHSRGDLWDSHRRAALQGRPLEVAVLIGPHPAIALAAADRIPPDDDELAMAGGLMGAPVPVVPACTVDLHVPAYTQMVIEGVIENAANVDEGPFGEYTGYASGRSTRNVLRVTAVTHRRHAIFQDVVPGASAEHLTLSKIPRVARVFHQLKQAIPEVVAINYPMSGTHFHCYVSMNKTMEGLPKRAALLLFGLDMFAKLVIVVDDDIDVYDEKEVLWALATRFQADKDLFVVPGVLANVLDPTTENGLSAKMGLDATLPLNAREQRLSISPAVRAAVDRLLQDELPSAIISRFASGEPE